LFSLELEIFYTEVIAGRILQAEFFYTLGRLGEGRK